MKNRNISIDVAAMALAKLRVEVKLYDNAKAEAFLKLLEGQNSKSEAIC